MSVWRTILRWFGFHQEARVQITAPGIEVTLSGDPNQVRALMGVIRTELERRARRDRRLNNAADAQVVQPTELDEMDSPYALPEAVVMPVSDDKKADPRRTRLMAMSAPSAAPMPLVQAKKPEASTKSTAPAPMTRPEQAIVKPWPSATAGRDDHQTTDPSRTLASESFTADDLESVRTAVSPHPDEGPTPPLAEALRADASADNDTIDSDRTSTRPSTHPLEPVEKTPEPS